MKKIFLMAVMAMAILAGCKKKTTNNDPVTPTPDPDPEPTVVDSSAWNIVALLSKDVIDYADCEIYEVTEEDSVIIPSTLTPELADTTKSITMAYYASVSRVLTYINLSDIKPYKSNNEIILYCDHARSFRIKLTRNSNPLPLDGTELNCFAGVGAEPKDASMDWNNLNGLKIGLLSHGVKLSQNQDTAEIRFQKTLTAINKTVKFDVKYKK